MRNQIKIGADEKILWEGQQNIQKILFKSFFNVVLILGGLWLLMVWMLTSSMARFNESHAMYIYVKSLLPSVLIVTGIYLVTAIWIWLQSKNVYYAVTNKSVYIQSGIITTIINSKPYVDISRISESTTFFDKVFHTGAVVFDCGHGTKNILKIQDILEYDQVFDIVNMYQRNVF